MLSKKVTGPAGRGFVHSGMHIDRPRRILLLLAMLGAAGILAQSAGRRLGEAPPLRSADSLFAQSARSGLALDHNNRAAVAALYRNEYIPFRQIANAWTGSVNGCRAGQNSEAYDQATMRVLRFYRRMAGVSEVIVFDEELNRLAMKAALIMEARNDLSHNPPRNWPCFSEDGKKGAGSSNLCLGCVGPSAIDAYVTDSGVQGVGHRRWALHPQQLKLGTGSTRRANALYVLGGWREEQSKTIVQWPPPGYVPNAMGRDASYPWSVEFYGERADYTGARISVRAAGRALRVEREPGAAPLVWFVRDIPRAGAAASDELAVDVKIETLRVDGQPRTLEYRVIFFNPEATPPPEEDHEQPEPTPQGYDNSLNDEVVRAAYAGEAQALEGLLQRRANPDAGYQGWTALQLAAYSGRRDCVEILLNAGANASLQISGWTALQLAESRGHAEVVQLLQSRTTQSSARSLRPRPTPPAPRQRAQ
ncbi:MAG: ankyrin repeat domain-containing protein [Leptospirales bacterium]|nr:ankyrin repeat domain-containing protein [Leptospirales bacterium]